MEKPKDKITSPHWSHGLSVRAANVLFSAFRKDRGMRKYSPHKHIEVDFDSHTHETIRPLFKKLLDENLIYIKRVRNMGPKTRAEFYEWCEYKEIK